MCEERKKSTASLRQTTSKRRLRQMFSDFTVFLREPPRTPPHLDSMTRTTHYKKTKVRARCTCLPGKKIFPRPRRDATTNATRVRGKEETHWNNEYYKKKITNIHII